MKIGVISGSLEAGGAQRVCLKIIEALKEANHEVALITLTKTDWLTVEKMLGKVIKPDQEIVLLKRNFSGFNAYKPLLAAALTPRIRRKYKLDLLINSQADTLPIKSDILYVHYPTFSEFERVDINFKYSRSVFWRVYISLFKVVHRFFASYLKTGVLVTNSNYSKKALKKYVDRNCLVIYPPVEVKEFATAFLSDKRQDKVVSCGRYSPEKNYENVLEVAKRLKKVDFAVVGSFSGEKSTNYYQKLCLTLSEEKLTNVELLKTLEFNNLLALYGKSKIYLHSMKDEHFGIVVLEAMAAGLVPVVYQGGGPWEDILKAKQGYYGFSYRTAEEAGNIIKMLLAAENVGKEIVERNRGYTLEFSDEVFKERFMKLLNKAL
jgi:glycosyltransferase involved in cell wall biosynthesis